jgi:hypothetical protein
MKQIFLLTIFVVIVKIGLSQGVECLDTAIYGGLDLTLDLDPTARVKASNYLHKLVFSAKIMSFLNKEELNQQSDSNLKGNIIRDSIIIKLKSGVCWEYRKPPKRPIFFFIRLLINKCSKKINDRIEYSYFVCLVDQKKECAYKAIDFISIYRFRNNSYVNNYKFKVGEDDKLTRID